MNRYNINGMTGGNKNKDPNGDWIKYLDHLLSVKELKKQNKKLIEERLTRKEMVENVFLYIKARTKGIERYMVGEVEKIANRLLKKGG